jgi:hypothetical protein
MKTHRDQGHIDMGGVVLTLAVSAIGFAISFLVAMVSQLARWMG